MEKVDLNNPNSNHFLMAQIKTIDMFKSYPRLLIDKFDNLDFMEQEALKEKALIENIQQ